MKYLVIDRRKCTEFVEEFDNKEDSIQYAKDDFYSMCKSALEKCLEYYVLESVNPDENAENHYDGDVIYSLK